MVSPRERAAAGGRARPPENTEFWVRGGVVGKSSGSDRRAVGAGPGASQHAHWPSASEVVSWSPAAKFLKN